MYTKCYLHVSFIGVLLEFIRASIDDQQTVLGIKNANEMEGMIGCSEHHDATRARVK